MGGDGYVVGCVRYFVFSCPLFIGDTRSLYFFSLVCSYVVTEKVVCNTISFDFLNSLGVWCSPTVDWHGGRGCLGQKFCIWLLELDSDQKPTTILKILIVNGVSVGTIGSAIFLCSCRCFRMDGTQDKWYPLQRRELMVRWSELLLQQ